MKNKFLTLAMILGMSTMMTGCYTYEFSVGDGAQGNQQIVEKNHYVIYGLAPVGTSDPAQMAGGAEDYDVKIEHTFIDGLLNAITFGIYNPTTTTVTK